MTTPIDSASRNVADLLDRLVTAKPNRTDLMPYRLVATIDAYSRTPDNTTAVAVADAFLDACEADEYLIIKLGSPTLRDALIEWCDARISHLETTA